MTTALTSKVSVIFYILSRNLKEIALLLMTALLCLLPLSNGNTQQLSFNKSAVEQGHQFTYQWLDHDKATQSIQFTLTEAGLFERFRNFKTYKSSYAQKTILRRIKKQMRKEPMPGVRVSYTQRHGKFAIEAKGTDEVKVANAYNKILKLEQQVTDQYFTETYYQPFTNHEQVSGIKVDHVSIANDSVTDLKSLKPIILDKVSIQNIRKATDYVLSFVQSIPYSTLESRMTSSGAGFNPPLKVLWENQGDCDSKMTLTATLLRALMPRIEMAFIYIEGHAFIGINVPGKAGEVSIEHEEINYLLAEPTGPALLPLGKLAPESELAINQGHYSVQNFHEVLTTQNAQQPVADK